MSILTSLSITPSQLQKIDQDTYEAYLELEKVRESISSGLAEKNILKVFHATNREFETFIFSEEFTKMAANKGIAIKSTSDISDVVFEEPSDVNVDILDALFDDNVSPDDIEVMKKSKAHKEDIKLPTSRVEVSDEEIDEEIAEIDEIYKDTEPETIEVVDIEEEEEEKHEELDDITEKLFGYTWKSSEQGHVKGKEAIAIALAYGASSNELFRFEDSSYHYMIQLPNSLGKMVFTFGSTHSEAANIVGLESLYLEFVTGKRTATISVVGSSKKFLVAYENMFKESLFVSKVELDNSELSSNKFDDDNYELITDEFSKGLSGSTYTQVATVIRNKWKSISEGNGIDTGWTYRYGLNYLDYLYVPAEYLYKKGGQFVQVESELYYTPKIKKSFSLFEIGNHFSKEEINTKSFPRDTGRIAKNEFSKTYEARPLRCDKNGIETELFFYGENGHLISVSAVSYNYFVKYYGSTIETKLSPNFLVIMKKGKIIGFIPTEKRTLISVRGTVTNHNSLLSQLRSVDGLAFDSMKDATTIYGMSAIGLSANDEIPSGAEIVSEEEVKEAEKEHDTETVEALEELELEIETLESMKELVSDDKEALADIDNELEAMNDLKEILIMG